MIMMMMMMIVIILMMNDYDHYDMILIMFYIVLSLLSGARWRSMEMAGTLVELGAFM